MMKELWSPLKSSVFIALLFITGMGPVALGQDILKGEFWRQQVLNDLLEPWKTHAYDQEHKTYYTYLNKDWEPDAKNELYPGMIARHLFSFSVGYLLSGEEEYLGLAFETFEHLKKNAWDEKYSGWYYQLDRSGKVISTDKDMFTNAYVITGLAMYYIVTRDAAVKNFLDRSIDVMENHAWDKEKGGGYVQRLNRDLTIKNSDKVFSPQLAPVSGYLLYLYAATRQEKYLRISERILDMTLKNMQDEDSGWIMEGYDRNWKPLEARNEMMNTGHNVEVAWMLMRLYELNGNEYYRQKALDLNEKLLQYTFDSEAGIWYHKLRVDNPEVHSEDSPWWVQAYGNMFQLYLYGQLKQENYLSNYQKGAAFWNEHFMDDEKGGAYTSVGREGNIIEGNKAGKFKTSYHSVENGLLNMLYLDYWVNNKPVTLFYHINSAVKEDFYPLLLEDKNYEIKEVLVDGKNWKKIDQKNGSISLPEKEGYKLLVRVQKKDGNRK